MVKNTVNNDEWTVQSTVGSGKRRGGSKKVLALLLFTVHCTLSTAFPQQPQAQAGQPIYPVNAKYVQGFGPGYWPTAGSNLTLNLAAGTAVCNSVVQTYAGGTLTLAPSATNYVYLNPTNNCAPASNTTGFSAASIPIATVVTTSTTISSITDVRTIFNYTPSSGGSGGSSYGLGNGLSVIDASLATGADACAKMTAAGATLGSGFGTVDARGLSGSQTCASNMNFLPNVIYLFGPTIFTAASGVQFFYNNTTSLISEAPGWNNSGTWIPRTEFICNVAAPCLAPYGSAYRTPAQGQFSASVGGSGAPFGSLNLKNVYFLNTNPFGTGTWLDIDNSTIENFWSESQPPTTSWAASTAYSLGTQISDGMYIQQVTTAGTSGSSAPTFSQGIVTSNTWQANHSYAYAASIFDGTNVEQVTSLGGTSGSSTPAWNTTVGGTTTDGTVTWTNNGPYKATDGSVVWTNEGLAGVGIDFGAPQCGGNYYNRFTNVTVQQGRGWVWECYDNDNKVFGAFLWSSPHTPRANSLELVEASLNAFYGVNVEGGGLLLTNSNGNEFYHLYRESAPSTIASGNHNMFFGCGDVFGNPPVTTPSGTNTQIYGCDLLQYRGNGTDFVALGSNESGTPVGQFYYGNPLPFTPTATHFAEAAHPPTTLSATPHSTGGTLPAGTYYYLATAWFGVTSNETVSTGGYAGSEASVTTTGSTGSVTGIVGGLPNFPTKNYTSGLIGGYKIYRGTASLQENCLVYTSPGQGSADSTSWTDTGSCTSATPPATSSALAWSVDSAGDTTQTGNVKVSGTAEFGGNVNVDTTSALDIGYGSSDFLFKLNTSIPGSFTGVALQPNTDWSGGNNNVAFIKAPSGTGSQATDWDCFTSTTSQPNCYVLNATSSAFQIGKLYAGYGVTNPPAVIQTVQNGTVSNTLDDGSGNLTASGKVTGSQLCISSSCLSAWPSYPGAGIANSTGSGWGTSYSASNLIPASFIPTLNQNTSGNAATATALAATPSQCSAGQFATGVAASGNANCGTPGGTGTLTASQFYFGNPPPVSATASHFTEAAHPPTTLSATAQSSGGTLAAGTYYYLATVWFGAISNETTTTGGYAGSEASVTISGSTGSVTGTIGGLPNFPTKNYTTGYVGGYKIYRGTASLQENCLVYTSPGQGSADSTSWTDTGSCTSATPPTTSTAYAWSIDSNGDETETGNLKASGTAEFGGNVNVDTTSALDIGYGSSDFLFKLNTSIPGSFTGVALQPNTDWSGGNNNVAFIKAPSGTGSQATDWDCFSSTTSQPNCYVLNATSGAFQIGKLYAGYGVTNPPAVIQTVQNGTVSNTLDDGTGNLTAVGNVSAGAGTNVVYRCTTAGTLPVGALTIVPGNCGASTDTGLRVK